MKRLLSGKHIYITITKLEENKTVKGCSYGIEFSEHDLYSVVHILSSLGIHYGNYYL